MNQKITILCSRTEILVNQESTGKGFFDWIHDPVFPFHLTQKFSDHQVFLVVFDRTLCKPRWQWREYRFFYLPDLAYRGAFQAAINRYFPEATLSFQGEFNGKIGMLVAAMGCFVIIGGWLVLRGFFSHPVRVPVKPMVKVGYESSITILNEILTLPLRLDFVSVVANRVQFRAIVSQEQLAMVRAGFQGPRFYDLQWSVQGAVTGNDQIVGVDVGFKGSSAQGMVPDGWVTSLTPLRGVDPWEVHVRLPNRAVTIVLSESQIPAFLARLNGLINQIGGNPFEVTVTGGDGKVTIEVVRVNE